MKRRGISIPWLISYGIIILIVIQFVPGLISANNASLANFDNKNDPSYLATMLLPLIFFGLYLFKPWDWANG